MMLNNNNSNNGGYMSNLNLGLNHNSMIPLINNESFDRVNRQENL